MNAPHIAMMLDIETLSLKPTAYVTQIGVCIADLQTGKILFDPVNLWMDDSQDADIELGTVRWWMQQSDAARESVFDGKRVRPKHNAASAFQVISRMVAEHKVETVWASPAMYDLPILTNMWGGKKPWKYNAERDLMTLYKMVDPGRNLQPDNPLEHDAASDAMEQMKHLIAIAQTFPTLQFA